MRDMTARDVDIDVDLEVDVGELVSASAQVDAFIAKIEQMDDEINLKVDIDILNAMDDLTALTREVDSLDGRHIDIKVDTDNLFAAQYDLGVLDAQVSHLDGQTVDINVDVDTAAAHAQLAALQLSMGAMRGPNMSILGSGGIGNNGPPLRNVMGMFTTVFKISAILSVLPVLASGLQWLVGIIGSLGVAIGVIVGGLTALVSAIGVAAIGIGGFAALAIPAITQLYEKNAVLTSTQKALKGEIDGLAGSWQKLSKELEPDTFGTITKGVGSLTTALSFAQPIFKNGLGGIGQLFENFDRSLKGDRMQVFFDYLERTVSPLTQNIGNGLGYMAQGVANFMVALEPLTNWTAQGFENMMSRFADWGERMQTSDKMQAFMDYTMENMPKLGKITGNTVDAIVDFFAAFDVSAAEGFDWLIEKTQEFAEWASSLDENEGFQNMLERIKNDGPVVASILGNVATNLGQIITFISDIGRGEDGQNKLLGWMDKITGKGYECFGKTALQDLLFGSIWSLPGKLGINWMDVLGLSNIGEQIGNLNIGGKIKTALSVIPGLKGLFSAGTLAIKLFTDFKWPEIPKISWPSLPKFNWPSLPKFNWPNLPKFSWPKLPSFKWPAFPKFSWPSLPKLTVSLGKGLMDKLGFSTGLGRVDAPEMPAIVHKNEAILQDHNAQFLRDAGILKGDGRNPQIDTGAISAYGSPQSTTTYVADNRPSNGGTKIDVGGVQIIVQGGNTNDQTAQSVRKAVEQVFASLGDVIPLGLEG